MRTVVLAILTVIGVVSASAQDPGAARAALQARRQAIQDSLSRPQDIAQAISPLPRELDAYETSLSKGSSVEARSRPLLRKAKSDLTLALEAAGPASAKTLADDLGALLGVVETTPASSGGGSASKIAPNAARARALAQDALRCRDAFDGRCNARSTAAVNASARPGSAARKLVVAAQVAPVRRRLDAPSSVPPVTAAPSPQVQACLQGVGGYQSLSRMCASGHTTAAPLLAGLLDSLKEQFGTLSGVLMNILMFLFGLLTSVATGGVGLILKLIGLIGMGWGIWQSLRALYSAIKAYSSSSEGTPQRSLALRQLGVAGGGLLVMILMVVGGWGLGKTKLGAGAAEAMEGGMKTALDKTGLGSAMKSANAALAPLMGWLSEALPGAKAPLAAKTEPALAAKVEPGVVGKITDPELYRSYREAADKYGQDPDLIVAHMEAQAQGHALPHDQVGHHLQEGPTCAACSIANAGKLPAGDIPRLVKVLGKPKASDVIAVSRELGGKVISGSEITSTVHDGNSVIVALKIGREAGHAVVVDGSFSYKGQTFYSATDSNFSHRLFFPEASFDKMAGGGIYFPEGIDHATLTKLEPLPTDRPPTAHVAEPPARPKEYVDTNVLVHAKAEGVAPRPGRIVAQTAHEISVGGPEMRRYLVEQIKSGRISMDRVLPRETTPAQRASIETMTRILVKYGFEPKDARMVSQISVLTGDEATLFTREKRLTNQVKQMRNSRKMNADLKAAGLGPLPNVVRVGLPTPPPVPSPN